MLLRLNRSRGTLVAPTWRLRLGLGLRLPRRLGIAGRGPTIPLPINGRGVSAARAATTALIATPSTAASAAAPTSLGQQVLGDFRLGEVVLFGCDRGQPGRSSGHPNLRIPDRTELVRPGSGGRRSHGLGLFGLACGFLAPCFGEGFFGSPGAVSASAPAPTSAPASGAVASLFGRARLDIEAFDELYRLLAGLLDRVGVDRLDAR